MTRDEMSREAIASLSRTNSDIQDPKVAHIERFFKGVVIIVDSTEKDRKRRDYVYFEDSGDIKYAQNFEGFLKLFADKSDSGRELLLYIIGGLLALLVVGTVCYMAITTGKVPDVLSAAVTTILGFFFGTVATANKGK